MLRSMVLDSNWVKGFALLGLLMSAGCDELGEAVGSSGENAQKQAGPEPGVSKNPGRVGEIPVDVAVIEGVNVFLTEPSTNGRKASYSGIPRIVDGCLFVGEALVLWRENDLDRVRGLVAAAKNGSTEVVALGGAGRGISDGDPVDLGSTGVKCNFDFVWIARSKT